MTITEFSKKILKCTYSHFWYVLRGERDLSYKKAKAAAQHLDTDLDTWLDARLAAKRREAWKRYASSRKEN
jgi:hypothetical protein